jgi:hypothetical protein
MVLHFLERLLQKEEASHKEVNMLSKYIFTGTLSALCASVALGAQTSAAGQQPTERQPTTQSQPRTTAQDATTKLVGCVYREQDVPGRSPNPVERAGVLEDYILADTKMSGDATKPAPGSRPAPTGTSETTGKMYKLEQIADERLRAVVGKRVEVTGRIDAEMADAAGRTGTSPTDRSVGPDRIELPEFEVASMREIAGSCPTTPGR